MPKVYTETIYKVSIGLPCPACGVAAGMDCYAPRKPNAADLEDQHKHMSLHLPRFSLGARRRRENSKKELSDDQV